MVSLNDLATVSANVVSLFGNIKGCQGAGCEVALVVPTPSSSSASELLSSLSTQFRIHRPFQIIDFQRGRFPGAGWLFGCRVARELARRKIKSAWVRDLQIATICAQRGISVVAEWHTIPTSRSADWLRKLLKLPTFRGLIAISNAHARLLLEHFPDLAGRIFVEHSGFDAEAERSVITGALPTAISPTNGPVIGYFGSFYPGRGIDLVIDAAARLPQFQFLLVGGSANEHKRYLSRAAGLNCKNIIFVPKVSSVEVFHYASICSLLVAPYERDCEAIDGTRTIDYASPLKVVEAMSIGKPIIASRLGAIPEIIDHYENGILFDPGDRDAFTSAIQELLSNDSLRKKLSHHARASVQQLEWSARASRILGIF